MFDTTKSIHTLELVWKSQIMNEDETKILYEKIKLPEQDLKEFITEERAKDAYIDIDYMIDGINFVFWLNTNYFTSNYLGTCLVNAMCFLFNEPVSTKKIYLVEPQDRACHLLFLNSVCASCRFIAFCSSWHK